MILQMKFKLRFFFTFDYFLTLCQKAFTVWINYKLKSLPENNLILKDFPKDLSDGVILLYLTDQLTGKKYKFIYIILT